MALAYWTTNKAEIKAISIFAFGIITLFFWLILASQSSQINGWLSVKHQVTYLLFTDFKFNIDEC